MTRVTHRPAKMMIHPENTRDPRRLSTLAPANALQPTQKRQRDPSLTPTVSLPLAAGIGVGEVGVGEAGEVRASHWGRDLFAAVRSGVNTGKGHALFTFQAI